MTAQICVQISVVSGVVPPLIKAHTISNKLVSKVSAQNKGGGGGIMRATDMCSNFGGFR